MKNYILTGLSLFVLGMSGCKNDEGVNLFSIQDDKNFGLQVKGEIESDPATYPILPEASNPAAYAYLNGIRNDILNSGKVIHKDDFDWEMYIIKDDNVQNAFCTPGGYIYVYTGLIKYLDDKCSLAGVLGHEMAHADKRHSTEQLTKVYGVQTMVQIALGNNQGLLSDVAQQLLSLSFSRANETEADKYSVIYLCPSKYHADGAANFFQKIIDEGSPNPPAFLSTHPSPDNRVANIQSEAQNLGCSASIAQQEEITEYTQFKNSL